VPFPKKPVCHYGIMSDPLDLRLGQGHTLLVRYGLVAEVFLKFGLCCFVFCNLRGLRTFMLILQIYYTKLLSLDNYRFFSLLGLYLGSCHD
jgi:hypothetical protein